MKKFRFIWLLLSPLFILASCQNNVTPDSPDAEEFGKLLNRLRMQVEEVPYILDPAIDNYIATPHGSVIEFPAYSFVYPSGDTVKTSSVHVMIKELVSKSDIILQHSTSMTDRYNILESGGQIRINAQDATGQNIDAKGYNIRYNSEYTVGSTAKSMGLFRGQLEGDNGLLMWMDAPIVNDTVKVSADTLMTGSFYSFFNVDGLGWTNLDKFTEDGTYNVNLKLDDSRMNTTNTVAFFVFESELTVGTLNGFNSMTTTFFNEFYQFPATSVKFIVISHVDGIPYVGYTDYVAIGSDVDIDIDMNATSESELIDVIGAL